MSDLYSVVNASPYILIHLFFIAKDDFLHLHRTRHQASITNDPLFVQKNKILPVILTVISVLALAEHESSENL